MTISSINENNANGCKIEYMYMSIWIDIIEIGLRLRTFTIKTGAWTMKKGYANMLAHFFAV
jgi:hypothetical protein